jgi:signal transduction histidine kinase
VNGRATILRSSGMIYGMPLPIPRWLRAALASVALVAAVTAVIALLDPHVPALGLGALYLLAVVPIAFAYGLGAAATVSLASVAAFSYFFLTPRHSLNPGTVEHWEVLVALLLSTEVVSVLAARSQREARRSARLADQQAALRRVATLVARESPAADVFAAVAEEVLRVLGVEVTRLYRYETDGTATLVADAADADARIGAGTRVPIEGHNVSALVHRTGRAARLDDHADATGPLGVRAHELGIRCAVGTPIVVGDRLWGVIIVASRQAAPLPASTESRMAEFTELVATSISNVQARAEVAASRARIVAAADAERQRVVRDLHDGAQQQLVVTTLTLKLAQSALQNEEDDLPALLTEALDHAEQATAELRELAHGILPSALAHGGLRAGASALASRTPMPVELDVSVGRLPGPVEATAYFVIAEALTNVAKHARARHAAVTARIDDGTLNVQVRDDGVGGARPDGSGLTGLADRLAALDGELRLESPADGGTLLAAAIPLPG